MTLLLAALLASCSVVNTSTSEKTAYTETGITSVVAVVDDTGPDIGARDINLENAEHHVDLQPTIALRDDGGGGTNAINCNVDFSSDGLVVGYGHDPGSTYGNKYIDVNSSTRGGITMVSKGTFAWGSCMMDSPAKRVIFKAPHNGTINSTPLASSAIKVNSPTVPVPSWTSVPWSTVMRC